MTKVALVALASVVIAVGPAYARGGGGGGGGAGAHGQGGHGQGHRQQLRSSIPTRLFPRHHFFHGHNGMFFNNGRFFWGGTPYGYGYGYGLAYSFPDYVSTPTSYAAAYTPSYGYAPSVSPAVQTVVEFASGRYLLQGDGVTAPYRWVWLPNAPSDAPPAPAVAAPPASPHEPIRQLEYYRWTDADGVVHLTDTVDRIPERYRAKATRSRT